jgi:DNA-binding CsgD family transcriptional regulator
MFDSTMRQAAAAPAARAPQYLGPERRRTRGNPSDWLVPMLDEIDYGMLVINEQGQVAFQNHAARLELDGQHPLQLQGRTLQAQRPQDTASLHDALAAARRGLRRLLTLGEGLCRVSLSVVPLREVIGPGASFTLLLLGKRQVCEKLSVQGFARSVKLTAAETRVLEQLCGGVSPADIAAQAGVQVCTVRTQIGSIRAKTGAASIRELVQQVAVLPPLVGALRHGMGAMHG